MTADEYAQIAALALEAIAKIIDEVKGAGTTTSTQAVFDKMTTVHTALDGARASEDAELHKKFDTGTP